VRLILFVAPFEFCNVTLPADDVELGLKFAYFPGKVFAMMAIPVGRHCTAPPLTHVPAV
jgi:hypothetical protein